MNTPYNMIYQRTMKEAVAKKYGKPLDYFYQWSFAEWKPIQEAFYYGRELPNLEELIKMNNINSQWPIGSVSSDTLDRRELCFRFADHAECLILNQNITNRDEIYELGKLINQAKVDLISGTNDDIADSVESLMDMLSSLCPEDYYFGAHPDDGACFGYWEVEDEN